MEWFEQVRVRREERGLSQAELAKQIGVSQSLINRIEQGEIKTSQYQLQLYAALGLPAMDVQEVRNRVAHTRAAVQAPAIPSETTNIRGTQSSGLFATMTNHGEQVPTPVSLKGVKDVVGFYMYDNSMMPEFEAGDVIFIHPGLPPIPNSSCVFFHWNAGPRTLMMIKRLIAFDDEHWTVGQWAEGGNAQATFPRSEWQPHRIAVRYLRR